MKQVVAKKDFIANNKHYIKGDVIEGYTIRQIKILNEQGFIEPLTYEDLVLIERQIKEGEKL